MATPDEIRESELGNEAQMLGGCLGPLTTAACWFMKGRITRGSFGISKTSTKVEEFLVKREQSGT